MPHHNPHATIHGTEELMHLSVSVSQIIVDCDCCNDMQLTSLDFSRFSNLTVIRIGSHSLRYVNELRIVSLGQLEKVVIGMNCFTKKKNSYGNDPNRHFYLKNCERLKELKMGCYSFSDYSVCEIENLPSLEVIEMGSMGCVDSPFNEASLVMRSFGCSRHLMNRLASVEISSHRQKRLQMLSSCCV